MNSPGSQSLQRFRDAQSAVYGTGVAEIKSGHKRSHWMWFIFPQIQGLGSSEKARHYAIKDMDKATAFLQHPLLGKLLVEICSSLHDLPGRMPLQYLVTRMISN